MRKTLCAALLAAAFGGPPGAIVAGSEPAAAQRDGGMQQVPRGPGPEPQRVAIAGHVRTGDGRLPVRQAQVRAVLAGRVVDTAVADDSGRFAFTGLRPGRYELAASKEGYLPAAYGQDEGGSGLGTIVEVGAGHPKSPLVIRLSRGAVIECEVTDEAGGSMSGVLVSALRMQGIGARRIPLPAGGPWKTDDRGQARLYGLPAGDYYVVATPINGSLRFSPHEAPRRRLGYAATYYPGTASLRDAVSVRLKHEGQANVAFSAVRAPLSTVRGRVEAAEGLSAGMGFVQIVLEGAVGVPGKGVSTLRDGSFVAPNLTPGTYRFRTQVGIGAVRPVVYEATVTVQDDDVDDVVLSAVRMTRVTGRVAVQGTSPVINTSAVRVGALSEERGGAPGPQRPGTLNRDMTFEFWTWPGRGHIRVQGAGDLFVKSIRRDGVDVTDSGIDVPNGSEVEGIEVVLSTARPVVRGTATNWKGEPLRNSRVVVFHKDRRKWAAATGRYTAVVAPDENGTFICSSLPPGEYHVALTRIVGLRANELSQELLDQLAGEAQEVSLSEGQSVQVALKSTPPQ